MSLSRRLAASAALVALVLVVFRPVVGFEFVNFDDHAYVRDNPIVSRGLTAGGIARAFTTVHASNWHPLTWLSHMTDVQFLGLDPGAHHLVSAFLHAVSTAALFLALARMTGEAGPSWVVAALFGLHPAHVESVAWVAERKDVLAGLFWNLSLLAWAGYAGSGAASARRAALACFTLGALSKPTVVSFPVVLLLLDLWPLRRWRPTRGDFAPPASLLREKLPFLLVSVACAIATLVAQRSGGALQSLDAVPLGARVANALVSLVEYLGVAAWPHDLASFYPFPSAIPGWQVVSAALLLVAIGAACLGSWHSRPWLAVGWGWFLVVIAPMLGLVQVGAQGMADRYTYLSFVGLFVAVTWTAWSPLSRSAGGRSLAALLATAAVAAAGFAASRQVGWWKDGVTLSERALATTRDNWVAHNNLAAAWIERGRPGEAIGHAREALRIREWADARGNLGLALANRGDLDEAIEQYRAALRSRPGDFRARNGLAVCLARKGDAAGALAELGSVIAAAPDFAPAHVNVGLVLAGSGEIEEALASFTEAARLDPRNVGAHLGRGLVLDRLGKREEAVREFETVLVLDPGQREARANLERLGAGGGR
ncbi:MAG: tetratricopeptide repeat protein [Alphaproteobacteria bacterium]